MSGRVVGFPDAEGVPGVQVLAMDRTGAAAAATSAADGSYRVEDVDPGWVRLRARPDLATNRVGAYFDDEWFFCSATEIRADGDPSGVDFALPEGGTIRGRVLDHAGEPVPGAAVTARGLDFYNQFLARTATTDELGAYEVTGLDSIVLDGEPVPGLYLLSAAPPGEATVYVGGGWSPDSAEPVPASRGETTEADIEIPAPTDVVGRVVDEAGGGIPGATVTARVVGQGLGAITTSDEEGRFRLEAVSGAWMRVHATADGRATAWGDGHAEPDTPPLEIAGGGEVDAGDVVLEPEASLVVSVSGEGSEGARVRVRRSPDGALLAQDLVPAGGEVRFDRLPAVQVFHEVVPGADSPAVGTVSEPVELAAGEVAQAEAALPAGAWIVGRVVRREAGPLRGARVELVRNTGGAGTLPSAAATTDGDGRFTLGPLAEGSGTLQVSWTPFCSGDPGRVAVHAPSGRSAVDPAATVFAPAPGETVDAGEVALPLDNDRDEMDDVWELLWGLDPGRADGGVDPDGDGVSNVDEYRERTDPLGAVRVEGGCEASISGVPALRGGPIVLAVIAVRRRRRPPRGAADPVC